VSTKKVTSQVRDGSVISSRKAEILGIAPTDKPQISTIHDFEVLHKIGKFIFL
jgi:hypothetical protein